MNKKAYTLAIFFTVFIDLIGVGIIIPVLPELFLGANAFYDGGTNIYVLIGLLTATYPLAQFFGASIIGAWSDKVGRKKALTISLVGTFVGYLVFAFGIYEQSILMLFISRLIDGFTGGNISIARSMMSDLASSEEDKVKNMGMIGMAFGLGYIIGPFIGGKLASPDIVSWFNLTTPFFFAAILSLINIILVLAIIRETYFPKKSAKMIFKNPIMNVWRAFKSKSHSDIFVVIFLFSLGFSFFTQFFQVYLHQVFDFDAKQIGNLFAFVGVSIAIAQITITRFVSTRYKPQRVLSFVPFVLVVTYLLIIFAENVIWLYPILLLLAILEGLSQPNVQAFLSKITHKDSQGEIFGINQSLLSLSIAIPPVISGYLAKINIDYPIMLAGIFTFLGWVWFYSKFSGKAIK